jgi:hypothetical protein
MNKTPDTVVLMCSKRDCCPSVTFNEDGSVDIVDTDDGRNDRVHLTGDQAKVLQSTLNSRF